MWQQRACYEHSNVVDVTIQCQFNVSAKNVSDFAMYGNHPYDHTAYPHSDGFSQTAPTGYCNSGSPTFPTGPESFDFANDVNHVTTKRGFDVDYESAMQRFVDYDFRYGLSSANDYVNARNSVSNFGYYSQCMNDSGYASPSSVGDKSFSANSQSPVPSSDGHLNMVNKTVDNFISASGTSVNNASFNHSPSPASDEPTEQMKLAIRERDVLHRLFSLCTADVEGASNVESYYQSQTSIIDIERHNVLSQMACNRKSSQSINAYYNRKLLALLENVEEKLATLESIKAAGRKRCIMANKKSRLLPKQAVKMMESWYSENLENPYPSRESTLSMAEEGGISVEQIRKWFANKRNRTRNSRLKASDAGLDEC
ncbi:uncharacterized protein LOC127834374 [Dreissena polymorpha]|uniref:Homeobox domain-containing protein n=1 Tax=Dreissena polymorpha TaxID=45954 RepID=A0A9D4MWD7_DREPO|nr:uncharacterized protein LOC127834374 [Dreissena polymorpha]KAH3883405.1 hypothetical protein DPMN_007360 [Dreissena polymorpha]